MEVSGKRSDITEDGAAEELEKLCEVCEVDHVTTKANGICRECEQFMCSTCFTTHIKVKSCKQHVLVDFDQSVTPGQRSAENVEKCKRHSNETIKFYCRKHGTVGCGGCMIPGHFACQPENIKDLSKAFQQNEDFKSLMTKLETIISANKENDKKVQESRKENEKMLEKALKEIKTFRTEINNYLNRAEESIIKEAKYIESENDKLLAKLEQECTLTSSKITDMRKMLDVELYQDSALFIQTVDCKPLINDIEKEVARIQIENDIRTFEFMPDKQLQDIITSTERLGSLRKSESQSPTKQNIIGLTKEVSREEIASDVEQTEPVEGKKENGQEQAKQIAVGARVRPIGQIARDYFYYKSRMFRQAFRLLKFAKNTDKKNRRSFISNITSYWTNSFQDSRLSRRSSSVKALEYKGLISLKQQFEVFRRNLFSNINELFYNA